MNTDKHIKSIDIENFRSFDKLTVEDFSQVNVIIGRNNSGKTALMEAIILAFMSAANEDILFALNQIRGITNRDIEKIRLFFFNLNFLNTIKFKINFNKEEERLISIRALVSNLYPSEKTTTQHFEKNSTTLFSTPSSFNQIIISTEIDSSGRSIDFSFLFNKSSNTYLIDKSNEIDTLRFIIYIPPTNTGSAVLNFVKGLVKSKQTTMLLSALQSIDKRIRNISVIGEEIFFDVDGISELMPMSLMGDGTEKIISCLTPVVVSNTSTAVFIDEIENGLHYSAHKTLWNGLLDQSKESGCQLFVTTHNIETLRYLDEALSNRPDMQSKLRVFDLVKTKNAGFQAYKYTYEGLSNAIELGNEIRL
ncbi:AAA family ATPase [Fibrella aquatilis]|uniref:AAA family ATPase n=1 Tax=Fibrella aquatilis TaxID=2817059 RepID=A0A939JZ23_9BACT|nr:ATP-binding protein [Fibrella aquatilis]MBO0930968.1 AAA family ATPase [Fibrella aquatilis]